MRHAGVIMMSHIQGLLALIKPKRLVNPQDILIYVLQRSSGNQAASGDDGDMNVNASLGTPSVFEYRATAGAVHLRRANVTVVDAGMTPIKFGGLSALTNGMLIEVMGTDGTTVLQSFSTDDYPIKANYDWGRLAGVDNIINSLAAVTNDYLPVRWTLHKAGEALLRLALNQYFRVTVRDNLSDLTVFMVTIQGVFE